VSLNLVDLSETRPPVAGTARLRFARCGEQTILERAFASSPVKLFTTRSAGAACWVYSATLGGGLVGGDEIRITLEAGAGAKALVATQASTKVYRSLCPASQQITASVDDEAVLVVLPDPIVCFAGAHFSQEQQYDLSARANLVVVDWMTSGRHAVGERWAFRHYASRLDVRRSGKRILYDAVLLREADGSIAERLERFEVCLTAVITGPQLSEAAIVQAATNPPVDKHSNLVISAWPMADGGALVRIVGTGVEEVGAALRERLRFLLEWLGDDPWSRKW
jgi:urease accessory protein